MSSADEHGPILRQSASIALALVPFGIAFGVVASDAGLGVAHALGFSALVFSGGSQFAAVSVLADGGTAWAAVVAGLLLNLRLLAFGVVMAPALHGPVWFRAAASHLMIDESTAVGAAQTSPRLRRYGYFAGGLAVFALWQPSTVAGAALFSSGTSLVEDLGVDATIPASFLALAWSRLTDPAQRRIAAVGALITLALIPLTAPGIPIIAAAAAALLARPWEQPDTPSTEGTP